MGTLSQLLIQAIEDFQKCSTPDEIEKAISKNSLKDLGVFIYYSKDVNKGLWRATIVPGNDLYYHADDTHLGEACAKALNQYLTGE